MYDPAFVWSITVLVSIGLIALVAYVMFEEM